MPIYEFYCPQCNALFQFFSRTINPSRTPSCPECGLKKMQKEVSLFSVAGPSKEGGEPDLDEGAIERAMMEMAGKAEGVDEDDPKAAARLLKDLTKASGMPLGEAMKEALSRMEAGEDPEKIEEEMGDRLEEEDPLFQPGTLSKGSKPASKAPRRVKKLYEL